MGSIYRYGIVHLAATGFVDGRNGLFAERDSRLLAPIALEIEDDVYEHYGDSMRQKQHDKGDYFLVDTHVWTREVDSSPLCRRGWVTQERAMSVRTLHFGAQQLFWECLELQANETYPTGFLSGTKMTNPKVFLDSGQNVQRKKMEDLQRIREETLRDQKQDEDLREMSRAWKEEWLERCRAWEERWGYSGSYVSALDSPVEELSDQHFAKRMLSYGQYGNVQREYSSDSSDPDESTMDFEARTAWERKRDEQSGTSVHNLELYPYQFDGCDLNVLDGLQIKGWKRAKKIMESWGLGASTPRISSLPCKGMMLEQLQWIRVVEIFSQCSLTFSSDKLVAVAGLAKSLSDGMQCEYLAGLWRKDLEHQLLWKVVHPVTTVQSDGTRGPSWTWASVDGPVIIPDWDNSWLDKR